MKLIEGVIISEEENGYILVTIGEAKKRFNGIMHLNATAGEIALNIKEGQSSEAITNKLIDKYDIDQLKALEAIEKVINQFKEYNLID